MNIGVADKLVILRSGKILKLNMNRFSSLGVIEDVKKRPMQELEAFFHELEDIFHEPDFTKAEVVEAIKRFLPNFEHVEKGKNLDQKM